jgi:hypothetical protein
VELVEQHDPATPLFIYLALHNTHAPVEAPQECVSTLRGGGNLFGSLKPVDLVLRRERHFETALKVEFHS